MSRPRAATSVATRTANRPALKSARARTRCGWLLLPWIAVAGDAVLLELKGEAVRAVLGPREDQRLVDPAGLDQVAQQLALALAIDRMDDLRHELGGRVARRHLDERRVVEEAVGEPPDLVREGRREQQVLAGRRQEREDLADVADEAHVEHPVGLVEDEDLDVRQVDRSLADMVEQPARVSRRRSPGRPEARGPADRTRRRRRSWSSGSAVARRRSGRSPRPGARARGSGSRMRARITRRSRRPRRVESLDHRQDECGGLAGAGLGAGEQVPAIEDEGDGLGLDRGRLGVALVGDRAEKLGGQPEMVEGHAITPDGPSRSSGSRSGRKVGSRSKRCWTGALTGAPIEHEGSSIPDVAVCGRIAPVRGREDASALRA